jgi:hypothetical protein
LDAKFHRIKRDKATREHGVGIEAYIISPEAKERLYELVQDMWRNEVYPHQLLIGSQIMIWKGKKSVTIDLATAQSSLTARKRNFSNIAFFTGYSKNAQTCYQKRHSGSGPHTAAATPSGSLSMSYAESPH